MFSFGENSRSLRPDNGKKTLGVLYLKIQDITFAQGSPNFFSSQIKTLPLGVFEDGEILW